MKFKISGGRERSKNVSKYLIDWDAKSLSKPQFETKQFLKRFWQFHIVVEEFPVLEPGHTRLRCDIINLSLKISIEVDGPAHEEGGHFFHGKGMVGRLNFGKSIKRDENKRKFLELNGIQCCNIPTRDVKNLSVKYFKDNFDIDLL